MTRGGSREGSGRKKQGDERFSERCTPDKKEFLKEMSVLNPEEAEQVREFIKVIRKDK
jgi:hypothetical protein